VQLEYCTIRSPIDGRTGKLMVNRGNIVKANADTPMIVINQIDPIYVAFSVPQQELSEIKARRSAGRLEVRVTVPDSAAQPPSGTLSFIDNAVDASTGSVLLKATFPNHDRLLWPGQFVNASLQVSTRPNALLVPTEAIQTGQQGPYVYVVKPDQTVESRPVVQNGVYEHETIVENGVQAGEKVVTDGQLRLVPGASVKIQGAGAPGGAAASGGAAPGASSSASEARR
jgi:multidrug efflux system membrane fusion protein